MSQTLQDKIKNAKKLKQLLIAEKSKLDVVKNEINTILHKKKRVPDNT